MKRDVYLDFKTSSAECKAKRLVLLFGNPHTSPALDTLAGLEYDRRMLEHSGERGALPVKITILDRAVGLGVPPKLAGLRLEAFTVQTPAHLPQCLVATVTRPSSV